MKKILLMLGLMLSGCAVLPEPSLGLRISLLELRFKAQQSEFERTKEDLEHVKQIQQLRVKRFDDADDMNQEQSEDIRKLQSWQATETQKQLETPPAAAPSVPVKTLPYRKTK